MADIRFGIDGRGAERGAEQFIRSSEAARSEARKAIRDLTELAKAQQALGRVSFGADPRAAAIRETSRLTLESERIAKAAAAAERERIRVQVESGRLAQQQRQQESAAAREAVALSRQISAERARADRERSRADAQRLRDQQAAARALRTAESTLGGEFRGQSQRIVFEQRLKQAIDAGLVSQERANVLRRQADTVFSTNAVNARDLRLNMLGLNQAVTALASGFGIAIPGAAQLAAATSLLSKSSQAGFATLGPLVGILGTGVAVFGAMAVAAVKSARALDEIADSADAVGLSVEAFQELRFIGIEAGVKNIDGAISKFTDRLGELKSGGNALDPTLRTLGLRFDDLAKLGTVDALKLIADRTADIQDPARQAAVAIDLFGRGQIRMASVLRGGSEGISRLISEARELGLVMDEETVRAGEHLSTEIEKLSFRIKALSINVGSLFIPKINEAAAVLGHLATVFIDTFSTNDVSGAIRGLVLQQQAGIITAKELAEEIEKVKEESVSLTQTVESSSGLGFTKAGDEALKSISETIANVSDLRRQVEAFRSGGKSGLLTAQAVGEAEKLVAGLSPADLKAQAEAVGAISTSRIAVIAATARWILEEKRLEEQLTAGKDATRDAESEAKKLEAARRRAADQAARERAEQDQALISISDRIAAMGEEATALNGEAAARARGEEALRAYQRQLAIDTELRKLNAQAVAQGLALGDEEQQLIRDRAGALFDAQQAAREAADAQKAADKLLLEPFKNAIEGVQDGIAGAFKSGLDDALGHTKGFLGTMLELFKDTTSQIAALLVFNPILKAFETDGSGTGIFSTLAREIKKALGFDTPNTKNLAKEAVESGPETESFSSRIVSGIGKKLGEIRGFFGGKDTPFTDEQVKAIGGGIGGAIAGYFAGTSLFAPNNVNSPLASQLSALPNQIGSAIGAAIGAIFGSIVGGNGALGGSLGGTLGGLAGNDLAKGIQNASTGEKVRLGIEAIITGGASAAIAGILAKKARVTVTTRETDDPLQFQHGVSTAGPFGFIGLSADRTNDIPRAQAQAITEFFAGFDEEVTDILTQRQRDIVRETLSGSEFKRTGVVIDNELVKILKERFVATFSGLFDAEALDKFAESLPESLEKIDEVTAGLLGFLQERAAIISEIDDLIGDSQTSEAAKALKDLAKHFDDLSERAKVLGFNTAELARLEEGRVAAIAKLKTGFSEGIEDQILAILDPGSLAFRELERQQEERLKNAVDFEADLTRVQLLAQLEREKLANEQLQNIRALRDEILTGGTSSLSGSERIANAETAFSEQLALAQANPLGSADAFASAAATLRDLKREFLGGAQFAQFESFLLSTIQNVFGAAFEGIPGFATQGTYYAGSDSQLLRIQPNETASITRGAPIDPRPDIRESARVMASGTAALIQEVSGLRAEVRSLRTQNAELQSDMRLILNRKVAA